MSLSRPRTITISSTPYTLLYALGQGQQGSVYLITDPSHHPYALKIQSIPNQHFRQRMYNQITLHSSCKSQNIIKFIDSEEIDGELYVVLELGECSLGKYLETREGGVMREDQVERMIGDVGRGLKEIHRNQIVHRDIKADNVIIKDDMFKISDFGVSGQGSLKSTFIGTPIYIAPQILINRTNYISPSSYTPLVDIWSLGLMSFQLYFAIHPFYYRKQNMLEMNYGVLMREIQGMEGKGLKVEKVVERMRREGMGMEAEKVEERWRRTSKEGRERLARFWERSIVADPRKRMTAREVCKMFEGCKRVTLLKEEGEGANKNTYKQTGGFMKKDTKTNNSISQSTFGSYPHTANLFQHQNQPINRSYSNSFNHSSQIYPQLQKTQSHNTNTNTMESSSNHTLTRRHSYQPPNPEDSPSPLNFIDLDTFLSTTKLLTLQLSSAYNTIMSIKQIQYLSHILLALQQLSFFLLSKSTLSYQHISKFQSMSVYERQKCIEKTLREAVECFGELAEKHTNQQFLAQMVVRFEICAVLVKGDGRVLGVKELFGRGMGKRLGVYEVSQGVVNGGNFKVLMGKVRSMEGK